MASEELDKGRCRVHIWVQLHQAPLSRLGKPTFQKLIAALGEVIDPELEGMGKWERFTRIKVVIDPDRPLLDKLPLLLPGGERYEVLVHYERLQRFCLYCARIGHEVEGCEDRNTLLSHIKSYPVELHELMRVRLLPETGKWINKDYLIPTSSSRTSGGCAAAGGRAIPDNIDINEPPSWQHIFKRTLPRGASREVKHSLEQLKNQIVDSGTHVCGTRQGL
jgi:Zinc knuckle